MTNDKDAAAGDESTPETIKGSDGKIPENKAGSVPGPLPDEELMKKFTDGNSTHEIKQAAKEILASDSEVNEDKLTEAGIQFQKEKKEDKAEQAENEAEFEQPGQ